MAYVKANNSLTLVKGTCVQNKLWQRTTSGPVFSYKLRYIVGFWLVEMAISTNQKPTIYRNLYENTAPDNHLPNTYNAEIFS